MISLVERIGPQGMLCSVRISSACHLPQAHGPFLDELEHLVQFGQPSLRRAPLGVGGEFGAADQVGDGLPADRLDDHVDVVVGAARRAFHGPARLAAAGGIARSRDAVAEGLVGVFAQRSVLQPLVVAELDPAQVQHGMLHGDGHALSAAGVLALVERGQDAGHRVDAGARVADLRPGGQRRPFFESGCAHRAAHGLRDRLHTPCSACTARRQNP